MYRGTQKLPMPTRKISIEKATMLYFLIDPIEASIFPVHH